MKVHRFAVAVALVASCLCSIPGKSEEPPSPFEILHGDLMAIQNNLTNVKMRMRQPAGAGSLTAPAGEVLTPALACCGFNLERIENRMRSTSQVLEQLQISYTDEKNPHGLQRLETVHREMSVVSRGLAMFKMARTRDNASQALAGLIRPFNRWRDATIELEKCCSGDEVPDGKSKAPARKVAAAPSAE